MNTENIGYKILHSPLIKIIIGIIIFSVFYASLQIYRSKLFKVDQDITALLLTLSLSTLAIVLYVYIYKFFEKRKIIEFSTKKTGKKLCLGVITGVTLVSLVILIIYLNGGYTIISINPIHHIIPALTLAVSAAVFEEIIARGILFRIIEEKLGTYIALVISALLFGFIHIINPDGSLKEVIFIALSAGVFLAIAYNYTRSLWFPIGIHFAWNFTQSGIFGADHSAGASTKSLLTSTINGAEWLTGGTAGIGTSIITIILVLMTSSVFLFLSHKRGNIIKPYWNKTTSIHNNKM